MTEKKLDQHEKSREKISNKMKKTEKNKLEK